MKSFIGLASLLLASSTLGAGAAINAAGPVQTAVLSANQPSQAGEVPQITTAPSAACGSCFYPDLGYGLYDADPEIVGTITQTVITHIKNVNGGRVSSIERSWSNKTAIQTADLKPWGRGNWDMLDEFVNVQVLVEDGAFTIGDQAFAVGSVYSIATAEPKITVIAPGPSECASEIIRGRGQLSSVYEADEQPLATAVAWDVALAIEDQAPGMVDAEYVVCSTADDDSDGDLEERDGRRRGTHRMKRSKGLSLERVDRQVFG